MQQLVSPFDDVVFDIELDIANQVGIMPLHFPKMDKSSSATCDFFSKGACRFANLCPFRHVKAEKNVVCKHWLRGLCKKGDECEFLHVYDVTKMPQCYFFSMLNSCTNKECIFLHIHPESKVKECPWFNRGFCRRGIECRLRHVRRVFCPNYMNGFCPNGRTCAYFHAQFFVDVDAFRGALSSTYATPLVSCGASNIGNIAGSNRRTSFQDLPVDGNGRAAAKPH